MPEVILESVLTCPHCDNARRETMPTDACEYFYECMQCKTLLRDPSQVIAAYSAPTAR